MFVVRKYQSLSVLPALLLIVIMLWISVGENYRFMMEKNAIRKEIKRKIKLGVPEKDLFQFQLTELEAEPGFHWVNDHEFSLNGNLFDVVHRNGSHLKCISDDQETVLFRDLDQRARDESSKHAHLKTGDFKWICFQEIRIQFFLLVINKESFSEFLQRPENGFTGAHCPPPEV